jgi:antitoxin CcdA
MPPSAVRRARRAKKRAATLSLRADLVARAAALGLDVTLVVEKAMEAAIMEAEKAAERARCLAENEEAIDGYNAFIAKHGLFGEEFRQF